VLAGGGAGGGSRGGCSSRAPRNGVVGVPGGVHGCEALSLRLDVLAGETGELAPVDVGISEASVGEFDHAHLSGGVWIITHPIIYSDGGAAPHLRPRGDVAVIA